MINQNPKQKMNEIDISTISWSQLDKLKLELEALRPEDVFLKTILEGAMRVACDKENPIRGNLLASALRELVGHVLHELAPDTEVRKCAWFVQAKDSATITRRQRAEYIIRAGLPNDFVDEELKINLSDEAKPLIKAVEDLNRSTHVREETIVFKGQDVRFMFNRILHGLLNLLKIAQNSRAQLKETIADVIHHAIFENLISDAIQELDEISTHTIIDGHYIDAIVVRTLNATEIQYVVAGEVEVELQYGSNSDVRNDNGFRKDDSYPYTAVVNSNPAKPMEIRPNEVTLQVDNSSFYE
ncbi:MAG: hypothetical protein J0L55_12565 [Caulobacterales bacterium]|nr:hypothetical protein [Caulobacterales bacterium]